MKKNSKFSIFIILKCLFATPSPNRSEYKPKKSNQNTDFERRIFAFTELKYSVIRKGLPLFLPCVIKKFVLSKFCDLKRIEFWADFSTEDVERLTPFKDDKLKYAEIMPFQAVLWLLIFGKRRRVWFERSEAFFPIPSKGSVFYTLPFIKL